MPEIYFPYIAVASIVFSLLALFVAIVSPNSLKKANRALHEELDSYQNLIADLQQQIFIAKQDTLASINQVSQQLTEEQQVSKQLEHRIKQLQEKISHQDDLLEQLQSLQSEDKLYTRAQKMVALGADIEEIMQACELPRAEAELLVSMHQRQE